MKKRYTLDKDVICHIFKAGERANGTTEPNDGAGGHATQDVVGQITEYKITGIPRERRDQAATWFSDKAEDKATLIRCPFPHIATFKIKNTTYTGKSMFPGHLTKDQLVKTMERALTSCSRAHTYQGQCRVNSANGRAFVEGKDFQRPLSNVLDVNGDYVEGRADGLRIRGQLAGGHGGLTSVFPNTTGFHLR